jgi:hypothetical protein
MSLGRTTIAAQHTMTRSYLEYITAQTESNPCFEGFRDFVAKSQREGPKNKSRVYCVEYFQNESSKGFDEKIVLDEILTVIASEKQDSNPGIVGRILFIEDIEPHAVGRIGSMFDINPLFFATYLDTTFTDLAKRPPPPTMAIIPSRFTQKDAFHVHYQRAIDLGKENLPKGSLKPQCSVSRAVKPTTPLEGLNIGLARTCCSMWLRPFDGRPWLCEPPFSLQAFSLHLLTCSYS